MLHHAWLFVNEVHLNLAPHVTVSARRTTAVVRDATRWVFLVLVVDCKVSRRSMPSIDRSIII